MKNLRIIPLGGVGSVTQNMFLYEYENEILIVDCGIGFPDVYQPGVDAIIPDISYLLKQVEAGKKIVGMIFSHGHDDHIAAAPYLLPELPDFPIYASSLTAGFAQQRLIDKGIKKEIKILEEKKVYEISDFFQLKTIAVTHSVPDARHLVINTPEGLIYHGSDFKLDTNPVDGVMTDIQSIAAVGNKGVLLALLDCLRVERSEWTKSESTVGPVLEKLMQNTKGKFVVTLMSSHLHRIQQTINAAEKQNRKVVFVGRSVEQNTRVSSALDKLSIPKGLEVNKKHINDVKDNNLCVIIAGSQGQEGSSMMRAVYGEHREIQINEQDRVVFSADVIPGNEIPYYNAIDELCRNNIDVIYPDIEPDIHQSGHASSPEQMELLSLLKPQYVMPIGGADRHRVKFRELVANEIGFSDKQVLIPETGRVLTLENQRITESEKLSLQPKIIDGLGIGDVGKVVLSDRLSLSQAGIIVLVLTRVKKNFDLKNIRVVSRGFVFMKQADEVVDFIKDQTAEIINKNINKKDEDLKKAIERSLSKKLYKVIRREPMIVPVILDN
jgi:ribonuclease J